MSGYNGLGWAKVTDQAKAIFHTIAEDKFEEKEEKIWMLTKNALNFAARLKHETDLQKPDNQVYYP